MRAMMLQLGGIALSRDADHQPEISVGPGFDPGDGILDDNRARGFDPEKLRRDQERVRGRLPRA